MYLLQFTSWQASAPYRCKTNQPKGLAMDNAAKVPDYILEKSKEFAWTSDKNFNYQVQRLFAYYIDDKGIFVPFHEVNFDLLDLAIELEFPIVSWLGSYLRPNYSAKDGMIESFVTLVDIYRNKRQTMKAGKYLKKVFPFLTDSQVEKGVAWLKAAHSPLEFELVECGLPESFEYAYKTPHVPKQSPNFDNGKDYYLKRLDCSCMRGENFSGWRDHPAKVYGFGDLKILYAKEKQSGKIGARVIIFPANESASSIYTANDVATELLVNYLESNGYSNNGIGGARVSKIQHRGENYLMPYVDDIECCQDQGDCFILGEGSLCCNSTNGTIYLVEMSYCTDCEDEYEESDLTEIGDSCVCRYCLSNNYTYSTLMDQYIPNDDACENGNGESATQDWFERSAYVCDVDGLWQDPAECVEYEGDYYHESHCNVTSFDGVMYHEDSDELREAIEAKEKLDAAYQFTTSTQLDWKLDREEYNATPYLAMITTKERTLRDNYQLNEMGEPERLPEFEFA